MTEGGYDVTARVLDFWFGSRRSGEPIRVRTRWFRPDADFDAACAAALGTDCERALAGALASLEDSAHGSLALVILLDQIPRNIFRGTAEAFAGDARARTVADRAIAHCFDRTLAPAERMFRYLPFEHAETLADQDRAVALFADLGDADWLDYAHRHRAIIARFGRFPHRNAVLGRASTPEELAFLQEPGSTF